MFTGLEQIVNKLAGSSVAGKFLAQIALSKFRIPITVTER